MAGYPEGSHRGFSVASRDRGEVGRGLYRDYLKRPIDVVVSAAALIACLPVMAVACALISLETSGLPVYKQKRVGVGGKSFDIYKLRTMYEGADRLGFVTIRGDLRITRLGKFLRDTKIDELPQLWNILRGDMSLIGPRPLSVDECEHVIGSLGYGPEHPGFYPSVLPGLTGLEQIYRIHPLDYRERFLWNAYYETDLSLILDLKVLYATFMMCQLVCIATIFGGIVQLAWIGSLLIR